jgi:uncharacterized protein (TIGR03118 family)
MRKILFSIASLSIALILGAANPAIAQFYTQHNLVSDGAVAADLVDPSLVNAWGLVSSATSPWWVANNGTDTSTLYTGAGAKVLLTTIPCHCVNVPGAPTGVVFNGGAGFVVRSGAVSGPARFIFATEDGTILGWNPGVPPPPPSSQATLSVTTPDAVYKGLAIASTINGDFLYATNFHAGTVDVFDKDFKPVQNPGAFTDPKLPKGYAPFGIRNLDGIIYVTYALQNADKHDDVAGKGHGFVNAFTTAGGLIQRVASKGTLDSPWGLALSPDQFGKFSNNLLVGNFGDGRIHAYEPRRHGDDKFKHRGMFHSADGPPLKIDGLWSISFGNGAAAGPTTTLFFTAGPFEEAHGLFGSLVLATPPKGDADNDDDNDDGNDDGND